MKTIVRVSARGLVAVLSLWLAGNPLAGSPSARDDLILVENGAARAHIIVSERATEPESHAARELARFLEEISGAAIVVAAPGDAPPAGSQTRILVGPDAASGIVTGEDLTSLGSEGYIIRTGSSVIAIAGGRPRGTLYGVYSLLEDELDCRWFTPDCSRIPKRERIELRPLDRRFVPRLEYRATDYPNSRDADWAARNKLNGTQTRLDGRRGGKVAYGPFVHTFNSILDPATHFDAHPEYFSEIDGQRRGGRTQLCLTNPEVQRIAIETVRGWMRSRPDATVFSVSQNDWHDYCTCADCSRIMEEEGAPSGLYLRFVNVIADAVREEFPGNAISTLAYQYTRKPPRITVPRPNVIVRLCSIECCFAHPLVVSSNTDRVNADFAADIERWGQISDRLHIWDYVINYAHSIMPFPNLYVLKPNVNFFIEHGVKGIYEEANYFSSGGEFAELRTWIIAKTLWDPVYDTDRAIDEFLAGYYEDAAPSLRRYVDLIHGKARMDGVHFHIFDPPTSRLFSSEVLSRAIALFEAAERSVERRPRILHRVRVARLPLTYVRIAHLLSRIKGTAGGGGDDLATLRALFERFDAVAQAEGITRIRESRTYDDWASEVRALGGRETGSSSR